MSLKDLLFPLSLILIIALPTGSLFASVSGDEETSIVDLSREGITPSQESMFLINGNSNFDLLNSISTSENGILQMEKNSISDHFMVGSTSPSYNGPRRSIITYDELTFFTYSQMDQTNQTIEFFFMVTNEKDGITEGPVTIGSLPNSNGGYIDIEVHDDTIFFLMSNTSVDITESGIFLKMVPIEDWALTLDRPMLRLDLYGDISSKFKVLGTEIGVAVLWMEDLSGDIYSMVFDGSIWGNANVIRTGAQNMYPIISDLAGTEQVSLIYTNLDGAEVNITNSLNGGLSFGVTIPVGTIGKGTKGISAINGIDRMHIAALNADSNLIYHFHSDNIIQWKSSGAITPYIQSSSNPRDELQITIERDNVLIAYEGDDMVKGIISFDGGNTFNEIWNLSGIGSGTPMMDQGKGYIGFQNGDDWIVKKFTLSDSARLITEPLSPLGLKAWDSIGFNTAGASTGTSIGFRLVDENGDNLYPVNDYIDIDPFQSGTIHGHEVKHLIPFEELWSNPGNLEESIRIDLRIFRGAGDDPVIMDIILDMTVGYPLKIDMSNPLHLDSLDNVTITSKGLELNEFNPSGTFTIGPLWKENGWPDTISVKLGAFSNKIGFTGEILDRNLVPIRSFSMDDSGSINTIGEEEQITWNGNHFSAIPDSFDQIFLKFRINKVEPTADPFVEYLVVGFSEPPFLVSSIEPPGPIFRGETVKFNLHLGDREDKQKDLKLTVESKPSTSDDWGMENYIDGVLWNSTNWNVFFSPPFSATAGNFDLRYWIEDLTGNVTGPIELSFGIEVMNIAPRPPVMHVEPAMIRTGDDVFIVMDILGTDAENGTDLTYYYQVLLNGNVENEGSDICDVGAPLIVIPGEKISRDDTWSIDIRSFDGISNSNPTTLEFGVVNSAPRISDPPLILTLEEDVPQMVQPSLWFGDIDGDTLSYSIETAEGVNAIASGDTFTIEPWENWNGRSNLTVTATDGEFDAIFSIDVEVIAVNDAPVFNIPGNISMKQGEDVLVPICCRDDVDQDATTVTSNIFEIIPSAIEGEDILVYPNGSIWIRASNEMVGEYDISFTGSDGKINFTRTLHLTIQNVNSKPLMPVIEMENENRIMVGPTEVHLNGSCFDEDVMWGDILTFTWSSSIQGNLGTGKELTVILEPGLHIITLNVSDSEGGSSQSTFEIKITDDIKEEKDVMRTFILIIIMVLLGLILGCLIGFLIFKRSKKEKTEGDEEKKEEGKDEDKSSDEKKENEEKTEPKEEVKKEPEAPATPPAGGDAP